MVKVMRNAIVYMSFDETIEDKRCEYYDVGNCLHDPAGFLVVTYRRGDGLYSVCYAPGTWHHYEHFVGSEEV